MNKSEHDEKKSEYHEGGITTREAIFGTIGDEPVEISSETVKQFDRMIRVMHSSKHNYDVPF